MVLVVCRLATPHPRWGALVEGVRQGCQEGERARGALVQRAACPWHKLLRLGCRRGGQLEKESGEQWKGGEERLVRRIR